MQADVEIHQPALFIMNLHNTLLKDFGQRLVYHLWHR